ncbi:MAG: hypothetical protein KC766_19640 [Myxococcales bacterium]|nr:hypothetical protein [Myxococcales bacterium]
MRARAFWVGLLGLALLRCSSAAAEGEACDRAKSNSDCQSGLVCTAGVDVQADHDVCCPPQGNTPEESGCRPATEGLTTDAGVGSEYSSGGSLNAGGGAAGGAGATGGSAGATGGSAGATGGSAGTTGGSAGTTGGSAGTTGGSAGTTGGSAGTTGGSAGSN